VPVSRIGVETKLLLFGLVVVAVVLAVGVAAALVADGSALPTSTGDLAIKNDESIAGPAVTMVMVIAKRAIARVKILTIFF